MSFESYAQHEETYLQINLPIRSANKNLVRNNQILKMTLEL